MIAAAVVVVVVVLVVVFAFVGFFEPRVVDCLGHVAWPSKDRQLHSSLENAIACVWFPCANKRNVVANSKRPVSNPWAKASTTMDRPTFSCMCVVVCGCVAFSSQLYRIRTLCL